MESVNLRGAKLIHGCVIKQINHQTARNQRSDLQSTARQDIPQNSFHQDGKGLYIRTSSYPPMVKGWLPQGFVPSCFQDIPGACVRMAAWLLQASQVREASGKMARDAWYSGGEMLPSYTCGQLVTAIVKPNCWLRGCKVEHKMHPLQRAFARTRSPVCLFSVYYCNHQGKDPDAGKG